MQKIKNARILGQSPLRQAALSIAEVGLRAIDTAEAIKSNVVLKKDTLSIKGKIYELSDIGKIFVVGIGKCSFDAAKALEEILGSHIYKGMVIDMKSDNTLKYIKSSIGDHPFPTDRNVDFTTEMIEMLKEVSAKDLVIAVVSGGGSTMLCQPVNFTCQEEREILECLFRGGANIYEINTVRKHLSLARGGFLAKHAFPARLVGLIFSDVIGDDLEFVASGPTMMDTTTVEDAKKIAEKYFVNDRCGFDTKNLIETPKDEKYFEKVDNILLVSNIVALQAMEAEANRLGFNAVICDTCLSGEASNVGRNIVESLHKELGKKALLYGGETVVRIRGSGIGGRNQEMALAALPEVKENEIILPFASDGRDNTDAAGAICDTITMRKAQGKNLDPEKYSRESNSYPFFKETADHLMTGITGSNTADFVIALKA